MSLNLFVTGLHYSSSASFVKCLCGCVPKVFSLESVQKVKKDVFIRNNGNISQDKSFIKYKHTT